MITVYWNEKFPSTQEVCTATHVITIKGKKMPEHTLTYEDIQIEYITVQVFQKR